MNIQTATTEYLIEALVRFEKVASTFTNDNLREGENAKLMVELIKAELKHRWAESNVKNNYVCFYRGKRWDCQAETSFRARDIAAKHFGVRSRPWDIVVVLADKEIAPASIG